MKDKEQIMRDLEIDASFVKPCSPDCCHYGEGCALGYPLYAEFNGFGITSSGGIHEDDMAYIKMMYSKDFAEYWASRNHSITEKYLPCFHTDCSWERCHMLDDVRFMSRWLRERNR